MASITSLIRRPICSVLKHLNNGLVNKGFLNSDMVLNTLPKRSIFLLTEFNCVDNSELGQVTRRYRKPYLIGFYKKRRTANVGDVIKVAVKGRPCKALVISTRKPKFDMTPRYDRNNIVLLDDNHAPLGTRIKGPVPAVLRKHKDEFSKVLALAGRFV